MKSRGACLVVGQGLSCSQAFLPGGQSAEVGQSERKARIRRTAEILTTPRFSSAPSTCAASLPDCKQ
jgi:hypothetical protein